MKVIDNRRGRRGWVVYSMGGGGLRDRCPELFRLNFELVQTDAHLKGTSFRRPNFYFRRPQLGTIPHHPQSPRKRGTGARNSLRKSLTTSPAQNNGGIGRKTQNEFFRGLLAPWGFGEHPKTHTFLESTCPEVNETAIKISNFGRYPQFRRPSNFGPPSGAILTPTCARAWEAHAGCVSKPPGGLWRG